MPITRQETLEQYTVNDKGIIESPGKFEGNMLYAPYFHDCYLEGLQDEDDGDEVVFRIRTEDFDEFPELVDIETVRMRVNDQGFVSLSMEMVKESVGF